jgi:hypothetical protein
MRAVWPNVASSCISPPGEEPPREQSSADAQSRSVWDAAAVGIAGCKRLEFGPVDPNHPNVMRCFGFSFTMPPNFRAPDLPIVPDDSLFGLLRNKDSYFAPGNVKFANGKSISPNDACKYPPQ